jgi:hypothetical protein
LQVLYSGHDAVRNLNLNLKVLSVANIWQWG